MKKVPQRQIDLLAGDESMTQKQAYGCSLPPVSLLLSVFVPLHSLDTADFSQ